MVNMDKGSSTAGFDGLISRVRQCQYDIRNIDMYINSRIAKTAMNLWSETNPTRVLSRIIESRAFALSPAGAIACERLTKGTQPRIIIDIGAGFGTSTLSFALACSYYKQDDVRVIAVEPNALKRNALAEYLQYCELGQIVEIRENVCLDALELNPHEPVLFFLDCWPAAMDSYFSQLAKIDLHECGWVAWEGMAEPQQSTINVNVKRNFDLLFSFTDIDLFAPLFVMTDLVSKQG